MYSIDAMKNETIGLKSSNSDFILNQIDRSAVMKIFFEGIFSILAIVAISYPFILYFKIKK